jgi:D-alanyl-D-alanine carboxypeptidase/D-alanyl-D-alanine-endopeptidase (penicillin-binding protein 4)
MRRWTALALPLLLSACAATAPPTTATLPPPVVQALQCARLPQDALAVMVAPLSLAPTGATGLAHQPDRAMQPGSAMKLLTSVIALDTLGPNHRGYTELLSAATQQGDVLQGDLILRGGADPELELPQVWQMLSELRWQGVREVAGDIVLDRSLFKPGRPDLGVPPFDDRPEFAYNIIPDALQFTGNLIRLELRSDDAAVQARLLPPLAGVEIDNRLQLNDRACKDWDDDWRTPQAETLADGRIRLSLQGAYPRQCRQRPALQLFDRDQQAERQLRAVWEGLGGVWRGKLRDATTPAGARLLARHDARPWGELMRQLNKRSDNVYARLLYLSLSLSDRAADPDASSQALSDRVVRRWLSAHHIDATELVLDNGSGLSRSERITPRQMVELLRYSLNGPNAADLLMSLPTAGVDGTMRNRLKASVAAGRARLKTGTLRNVVALAGTVPDTAGTVWLVAAMLNDEAAGKAGRAVLDVLIDWIARTGLRPEGWREPVAPCPDWMPRVQ